MVEEHTIAFVLGEDVEVFVHADRVDSLCVPKGPREGKVPALIQLHAEAKVAGRKRETHTVAPLDGSRFADRSRDRGMVAVVVGRGETEHGNLAVFEVFRELFVPEEVRDRKVVTLCIIQRVSDTSFPQRA